MERQSISRKRNFASRLPQPNGDAPVEKDTFIPPALPHSKKFALSTPPSSSSSSPSSTISFPTSVAPPNSADHLNDGEIYHDYVINGCGKSVKAIHTPTNTVFVATSYNAIEAQKVIRMLYRIENGQKYYTKANYDEMSDRIWPKEAEFIKVDSNKYVLFVPSIEENVHTLAFEKAEDMTENDIQNVFFQLANITDFCHQIGIIVRDLKPRRMLLKDMHTNPKLYITSITDFTLLDDPEKDLIKDRFLTPAFVPPELLDMAPEGYSGKACDIWGMGVLLYMMIVGRFPFYDKTPAAVFRKIRRATIIFPQLLLSKEFTNMVHTLLQKAPEDRPTADEIGDMSLPSSNLPCRSKCQQMMSDMVNKFENMKEAMNATRLTDIIPELNSRREHLLRAPLRIHATKCYRHMKLTVRRNIIEINNITAQKRMRLENRNEWPPLIRRVAAERFAVIKSVYKRENREPHPGINVSNLPLELLLPPEVYPPRPNFRMQNYEITHEIYTLLKKHNSLKFPSILVDGEHYDFNVPIIL